MVGKKSQLRSLHHMGLNLDRPTPEGDGAPEIKPSDLPEGPLLEAAHRLSLALGVGVPLSDYAEAASLLFLELSKGGWRFHPPVFDTRDAGKKTK
jgi:hypothetical protein